MFADLTYQTFRFVTSTSRHLNNMNATNNTTASATRPRDHSCVPGRCGYRGHWGNARRCFVLDVALLAVPIPPLINMSQPHPARPPPPGAPPERRPRPPSGAPPPPPKRVPQAFDESKLPSVVQDGISPAEERQKRRRTCRFLEECGRLLRLPRVAVATSMVFFHRFYAKHSFAEHDRFEVAVACLLLAAKTEESPKKLTVVIQECHRLKNRAAAQARSAGKSPGAGSVGGLTPSPAHGGGLTPPPGSTPSSGGKGGRGGDDREGLLDSKSEEFIKLKERILLLERVILHTIGFELDIQHPYKFLVEQIKKLNHSRALEYAVAPPDGATGNTAKMTQELVQYGMNYANDSLHTTLCLQFPAKTVASACTYLACRMCKVRPVGGRDWPEVLHVEPDALASISVQLMELIAEKKGCDLAVFRDIRSELDKMASGGATGAAGSKRPLSGPGGSDVKKPRLE